MSDSSDQEPGRQESERGYEKLRAIREATLNCPCDRCPGRDVCRQTKHECEIFKRWTKSGK
jgi:hypothetical protein